MSCATTHHIPIYWRTVNSYATQNFFLYPLFFISLYGLHATVSEKNWHPHWWTTEVTYWSNRGLKINYGASWYFTTPFLRHCPLLGSFLSYQGGGTFFFYVPHADETWPFVIKYKTNSYHKVLEPLHMIVVIRRRGKSIWNRAAPSWCNLTLCYQNTKLTPITWCLHPPYDCCCKKKG